MSENTYLLELYYENTGVNYKGLVNQRVIDKIKKNQFVEFNLLISYNENNEEDTATYVRAYYSPVDKIQVNFIKMISEK